MDGVGGNFNSTLHYINSIKSGIMDIGLKRPH